MLRLVIPFIFDLAVISTSLIFMYETVKKQEKVMRRFSFGDDANPLKERKRQVFWKCVFYIGGFSCLWIPSVIRVWSLNFIHDIGTMALSYTTMILLPIQGLFNLLIYNYPYRKDFLFKCLIGALCNRSISSSAEESPQQDVEESRFSIDRIDFDAIATNNSRH